MTAETPALWIPAERTLTWRLRVDRPGDDVIGIRLGEARYDKALRATRALERRSPVRPGRSSPSQLRSP